LVIVHSIELERRKVPPEATGGVKVILSPWSIRAELLKPLAYQYAPGNLGGDG
jgi:hypothetical protein